MSTSRDFRQLFAPKFSIDGGSSSEFKIYEHARFQGVTVDKFSRPQRSVPFDNIQFLNSDTIEIQLSKAKMMTKHESRDLDCSEHVQERYNE